MGKAILTLVFKSEDAIEKEKGVYSYEYTAMKNVRADIKSKRTRFDDGQTINPQTSLSMSFSVLLSNDSTDRVNRISHIVYKGKVYDVELIEEFKPRVVITPGVKIAKETLNELLGEEIV